MASENKFPSYLLFIASSLLLTGGWMMAPFPIFIFFGIAPLFALTDRADTTSAIWEKMEWVFLALTISFLASHAFDLSYLVLSLFFGIAFTLPFIGYVWIRQTVGPKAGKISILFFWLMLEYLLLKFYGERSVFLGDALRIKTDWMRWDIETGYLGSTLWILLTNLAVYHATLSKDPFKWYWILTASVFLIGPIICSLYLTSESLTRVDMINLYSGNSQGLNLMYLARGEFVVRTATWMSVLILLFTLVRSQTLKR